MWKWYKRDRRTGINFFDEKCDCGGASLCANNACCFQNCTLKPRAKCSDTNDGCCKNCNIIPANLTHVCRNATNFCDTPEVCDGKNSGCPSDTFNADGISCSGDKKKCAQG
jgi:hypothetical protein